MWFLRGFMSILGCIVLKKVYCFIHNPKFCLISSKPILGLDRGGTLPYMGVKGVQH